MARVMILKRSHLGIGKRLARRRRGVSLVEVLVVMAVLILGMLAIARLFPEGFQSLSFTGNITTAQRLISLREEEARKNRENLPDAIYAVNPANPALIYSGLLPNDYQRALSQINVGGTPVDDPRFSNLNVARRVFGEQFQIPPPSLPFGATSERVSLYRALYSPIYSAAPSPAGPGVGAYAGTPLQRVSFADPPRPDDFRSLLRAGHFGYGVDYENGFLYLTSYSQPAATGRIFKAEFTYRAPSGGAMATGQSPADNTIVFPPGQAAQDPQYLGGAPVRMWVHRFNMRTGAVDLLLDHDFTTEATNATAGPGTTSPGFVGLPPGGQLDPGTDFLYQRFRQLALGDPFSGTDPFEFKVYDATTGLLGFNPIAANYPLTNQAGRGIMARIDYDVDDWSIMRYDDTVAAVASDPDGAPNSGDEVYSIKLPTGPIKQIGDTEETINFRTSLTDNTYDYQGLVRFYPDTPGRTGTPGVDLIVVDMQTGYQIDSRTLQRDPISGGNNSNGEIDYRAGVVRLWKSGSRSPGGGPPTWSPPYSISGGGVQLDPAGRHLRVYYRSYNDFAVASYKPFTRFHLQTNPAAMQHREYTASSTGGYLIFPNVDAERTVAVDYSYVWAADPGNAATWQRRTVFGELHQVQAPGTAFAPAAAPGFWWARLSHADSNGAAGDSGADPNVVPGSIQVLGVRGASMHTRVTWLEGKRTRYRERSTLLTREVTR